MLSWLQCVQLLYGKATLFEAAKFYVENHKGNGPKPTRIRFDADRISGAKASRPQLD